MSNILTDDSAVIVMLCSHLGLGDSDDLGVSPLTLKEWTALSRRINESEVKNPAGLLGLNQDTLTRALGVGESEANRITQLLSRGGAMAVELENLANDGIWCVTRADEAY